MSVASILKEKGRTVETITPDTTLWSTVWSFRTKGIGALVVSEDGRTMLGLISERDVVHGLAEHGAKLLQMRVGQLMRTSVITCSPDESITKVMAQMTRHRVRHVPVVEHGALRGIVSIGDVVKYRLDELEMEANILRETLITSH
jgi:CBS domain-containing protein